MLTFSPDARLVDNMARGASNDGLDAAPHRTVDIVLECEYVLFSSDTSAALFAGIASSR